MKKILFILCLACAPTLFTSCADVPPPAERVVAVQTLKSVGEAAETAVTLSAKLYAANQIAPAPARAVFDFYDTKFQPAFRAAVSAAKSDLSTVASPDVLALAAQLTALVSQLQTH